MRECLETLQEAPQQFSRVRAHVTHLTAVPESRCSG